MKLAKSLEKDLARVERRVEMLSNAAAEEGGEPPLSLFPDLSEEDKE